MRVEDEEDTARISPDTVGAELVPRAAAQSVPIRAVLIRTPVQGTVLTSLDPRPAPERHLRSVTSPYLSGSCHHGAMEGVHFPEEGSIVGFTADERPDLWEAAESSFHDLWPEYNHHGNDSATYFGAIVPRYAHLQVLFFDRTTQQVVARARTIPFRWDGSLEDLPRGIDAVGLRAVDDRSSPTSLSALSAEVVADRQREGLSRQVILTMAELARHAGLAPLLAPVRPSWKDRYPLISVDQYASWKRGDALPFDPWMRVHARLGASILRPEPRSMRIEAAVHDWEQWTGMEFPGDGEYVFPSGLAPLRVRDGIGHYWEPNVWMLHSL